MTKHDKVLSDLANRIAAVTEHGRSMLVEAGAGSGKTSLMAGRVALLLAEGVAPRSVAAVTFTELAASELSARIAEVVGALLDGEVPAELAAALPEGLCPERRACLRSAASRLDELTCTTIHGFCQRLITPYPVEADIDPGAAIVDRAEAERIFADILDAWLRGKLAHEGGLVAEMVLADPAETLSVVRRLGNCLREHRAVGTRPAEPIEGPASEFGRRVAEFASFAAEAPAQEADTAVALQGFRSMVVEPASPGPIDSRGLVALLVARAAPVLCKKDGDFLQFKGGKTKWAAAAKAVGLSKDDGYRLQSAAAARYDACCEAWRRLKENVASEVLARLVGEVRPVLEEYRLRKRSGGLLDLDDLLHSAANLLRGHDVVRRALAARYAHVLVDEFQDTDPLQTEIFWRLCGEVPEGEADAPWHARVLRPGALFLVGDPKQAIYRFRGADVSAYVRARAALEADRDARVVPVSTNFRSCRSILAYVNDRFADILAAPGQPGFTGLDTFHEDHDRGPCVAALDVPIVPAGPKPTAEEARDAEAEAVADLCARLIGQTLTTCKLRGTRTLQAGDIALLAPSGSGLWRYEEALERRGIPVATQAGKGFFSRQEVQDLIAVTRILADPRDTLALGAYLRGPAVGLTDEELLDIVHALPGEPDRPAGLSLYLDPALVTHSVARAVFERLQALAVQATGTTPHDVLSRAVDVLMLRPIVLQRHDGHAERALANVDLYLELARPYAVRGLRAFAKAMQQAWSDGSRAVEGRPDAQEAAVGLFTMHASKGLEWPVVIPINTLTQAKAVSDLVVDRTGGCLFCPVFGVRPAGYREAVEAEGREIVHERVRLWYVAATRAREVLVMPRLPATGSNASWSSVLDLDLGRLPAIEVERLPLRVRAPEPSPANGQTREGFAAEAAAVQASHRRLRFLAPSRDAEPTGVGGSNLRAEADGVPPSMAGGRVRGTIVHKLLEECLTGETITGKDAIAARCVELMASLGVEPAVEPASGPSPDEIADRVVATLGLPEIVAIGSRLRAEMPIYGFETSLDEDAATFGVVDAVAFDEAGRPDIVVDWKSDVAPSGQAIAGYSGQIGRYLEMTGAREGLLVFVSTGYIVVVERN